MAKNKAGNRIQVVEFSPTIPRGPIFKPGVVCHRPGTNHKRHRAPPALDRYSPRSWMLLRSRASAFGKTRCNETPKICPASHRLQGPHASSQVGSPGFSTGVLNKSKAARSRVPWLIARVSFLRPHTKNCRLPGNTNPTCRYKTLVRKDR
jgi:hypothetical protein